jgi:hypothetical protein
MIHDLSIDYSDSPSSKLSNKHNNNLNKSQM